MNELLALSLQSLHRDMARLDQVGMNLANVLTPGYRRGVAIQVSGAFAGDLAASSTRMAASLASTMQFVPDLRPGTLKSTGRPLDVAITGSGYFEVMTSTGPAYTRGGAFHVDARGRLVTEHGDAVMGVAGEITLDAANPAISAAGAITSPSTGSMLGQLKLVDFDDGIAPERLGNGLFAPAPAMKQLGEAEVQVRQGWLENSNAASTLEMATLVQSMRHFEAMQKVVQGYDEMLGVAIRKLGETG